MHDMTAKKAAVTPVDKHPNFQKHHRNVSDHSVAAASRPAQRAAFCVRIWRHWRRQRRGHSPQLGGSGRSRNRSALRRDAHTASRRRKVVRTQLQRPDRHGANGWPVACVAGRRSSDGEGCSTRPSALHFECRGRRHDRGSCGGGAGCVLAPALQILARRS